jgi:2'-5' RNA ligase
MDAPRESALLVPVPAAEPLVGEIRIAYDPAAALGVPAHITLLYPFVRPSSITQDTVATLRAVFVRHEPFGFSLREARWFGREVLYLAPEPTAPFLSLIGELTARFPDHPPYGGAFDEVVPHLTVADPGRLGVALTPHGDLVQGLERGLPVEAVADGVHLMIEGADARWSVLERFSLGWRA